MGHSLLQEPWLRGQERAGLSPLLPDQAPSSAWSALFLWMSRKRGGRLRGSFSEMSLTPGGSAPLSRLLHTQGAVCPLGGVGLTLYRCSRSAGSDSEITWAWLTPAATRPVTIYTQGPRRVRRDGQGRARCPSASEPPRRPRNSACLTPRGTSESRSSCPGPFGWGGSSVRRPTPGRRTEGTGAEGRPASRPLPTHRTPSTCPGPCDTPLPAWPPDGKAGVG